MPETLTMTTLSQQDTDAYIASLVESYEQYKPHFTEDEWPLYVESLRYPHVENKADATFVVKLNEQIVGGLQIYIGAEKAYNRPELAIGGPIIRLLFVHPSARGKGIAQKLLSFTYEKLRELGYEEVHLHSGKMMADSIAMYKYLGYERAENKDFYIDEFPIYCYRYRF